MRSNIYILDERWRATITDLQSVLNVLDETGAPADIGAHIDLAICRLENALSDALSRSLTQCSE